MQRVPKIIEVCANVGIIIVACLMTVAIAKTYFGSPPLPTLLPHQRPIELNQLSSLGIDWQKSQQTLVLALSNTCRYCTESASFYKRLASSKGSTRLVAILPQSTEEARAYLNQLGIAVDEIRQFQLDQTGVQGTPTIMLTDRSGIVKKSWVGKLSSEEEVMVLNTLQGTRQHVPRF